jgi:Flp pilus assembly protein TadG
MKRLKNYCSNESGATAVEFGMVSLLFLALLSGVVQVGWLLWVQNSLQYAIENTARYALTHPDATNDDLVAYAADHMAGVYADTSDLDVTTAPVTISGISFIEVNGTYEFTDIIPFLPLGTINLTAQSRAPYSL